MYIQQLFPYLGQCDKNVVNPPPPVFDPRSPRPRVKSILQKKRLFVVAARHLPLLQTRSAPLSSRVSVPEDALRPSVCVYNVGGGGGRWLCASRGRMLVCQLVSLAEMESKLGVERA